MNNANPVGSDPRLVAGANAADARNRPLAAIAVTATFVLAAAVFLIIAIAALTASSADLEREYAQTRQVRALGEQIEQLRTVRRSASDYGVAALMPNHVDSVRDEIWGELDPEQSIEQIISYPESPDSQALTTASGLNRATLTCTIRAQPIDRILRFVDAVLAHPQLQTTFVSSIDLDPVARGWNATVVFKRYEQTRN